MQECSVGFTTSCPQVRQSQSVLDVHLEDTDLPVLWSLTGRQCTGTTKPVNDHLEQSYSEEVRTRKEFNFNFTENENGGEGGPDNRVKLLAWKPKSELELTHVKVE